MSEKQSSVKKKNQPVKGKNNGVIYTGRPLMSVSLCNFLSSPLIYVKFKKRRKNKVSKKGEGGRRR